MYIVQYVVYNFLGQFFIDWPFKEGCGGIDYV